MTLDIGWSDQAVSALDLAALSASESIAQSSSQSSTREQMSLTDAAGPSQLSGMVELTSGRVFDSLGQGAREHEVGASSDYASSELRPTGANDVGGPQDRLRDYSVLTQLDQAYSSSLAATAYTDQQYLGRIADYTA